MTTMTWSNSEGTKGRCDAKCHNATTGPCHCMCGGRYHGAARQAGGLRHAMEQYEQEIVESANRQAAEVGLVVKFRSIAELFYEQQTFLTEATDGQAQQTQMR